MSLKEATYYTVICDWPDCGVSVDEGSDFSAWGSKSAAFDSLGSADDWHESRDGQKHYCEAHPAVWASDAYQAKGMSPPYLLIHDGDTGNPDDDGKVTLVENGADE